MNTVYLGSGRSSESEPIRRPIRYYSRRTINLFIIWYLWYDTRPHISNFDALAAEIGSVVWGTPQISTGLTSCLRYCSDVAQRRPTKLCTMFGCLLALRSAILAALGLLHGTQQRASAKLCGSVQGMKLPNFRRVRHLYSAGRPSRWASAHILAVQQIHN